MIKSGYGPKIKPKMEYLEPEIFTERFPISLEPFAEGTFGKIYTSGEEYIVKGFKKDPHFRSLICELNGYSTNIHPCIMKPIAWSIIDGIAFMAMPRGEDINNAYKEGKITIEEIISDSLSAIADMNSRGYLHGDIKDANMIFHEGRCKIIDMGLVRLAILAEDGNFYAKEEAYSPLFRDMEYYEEQYNNINSEVYALASAYIAIINGGNINYFELMDYKSDIPHLDWLFQKAKLPSVSRPNAKMILLEAPGELIVRRYPLEIQYISPILEVDDNKNLKVFMTTMVEIHKALELPARDLFLAVNLIHRSYELIIERIHLTTMKMYSIVILSIVSCVSLSHFKSFDYWEEALDITNVESKYEEFLINVLMALNGTITSFTYWDYAKSPKDFLPLLYDMTDKDYDINLIRSFESKINRNKYIKTQDISGINESPIFGEGVINKLSGPFHPVSGLERCKLPIEQDHKIVVKMWFNFNEDRTSIFSLLNVLYKNRKVLYKINIKVANAICRFLYENEYTDRPISLVLEKILGIEWREIIFFSSSKNHPFKTLKG